MTPLADRARRVILHLPPERVRALIVAELAAAVGEAIAGVLGRRAATWCFYCGDDFPLLPVPGGKRADARYCSRACKDAARRAALLPV